MTLKVCGMRDPENIRALESLMQETTCQYFPEGTGIQWLMGFIFYAKSPRFVPDVPDYLPQRIARTGVFVNETSREIRRMIDLYDLMYVQLHGKESPAQCSELQKVTRVIKAFSLGNREDLKQVEEYEGVADLFVFDTKCKGYGGSGTSFEWNILDQYWGHTPFLLSGGIGPDSFTNLRKFTHPMLAGYDLNSKFECAPALKEIAALRTFFTALGKEGMRTPYPAK